MLNGYFPKITLPSGKSDVRKGDGIGFICAGQAMLIDAFVGGEPTDRLKTWLMKNITPNENGTYVIDIAAISHAHDDHFGGVGLIADDNRFWIRMIICYDPDSLAFGVDSSMNGQALKKDIASFKAFLNHMRSKGTTVVYKDKGDAFNFGDITWEIWRKQPTKFTNLDGGQAWAFVNDGSLAFHSPETGLTYGGDGSDATKEAIQQDGWEISGDPVSHHGNSEEQSAAVAIKGSGCVVQWQSCIEKKGVGSTSWTTYGSQRALQQGIPVWQQDEDIYITAEGGQITFRQGSKVITKAIPYSEWTHDEKGWKCGDYKDGWHEISEKWYFFDSEGYTETGFFNPQGDPDSINRYLDPGAKGAMITGRWFQDEGRNWFFADGYGRILTGWFHRDGNWYYLDPEKNGAMARDEIVPDWNGLHYVDGWGIMKINCLVQHAGKTYYADSWGVIQTAQWLQFGGKWYSADDTGAFRVGWYDDPELGRRYLEPAMVTNSTRTIDGKLYRFDGYGVVTEVNAGVTKAVDVSEFNPKDIDWAKVRDAGYGAILRIGIRGSVKSNPKYYGKIRYDNNYTLYHDGVIKAVIPYGVYFFPTSISEKEAEEEAAWLIANVAGLPLSFPVFLDSELVDGGNGRADKLSVADRTRYLKIITDILTDNKIPCGIYASTSWLNTKLDMANFRAEVRKNTWVAQYNDKCTYTGEYMMWQYSSKGSVPGIKGNVDVSRITSKPAETTTDDGGKFPRERIVSLAVSLVGTQEGTSAHHEIIDKYNLRKPLPRGYAVKYTDPWCATFCSYLAIASGYTDIIPIECGCPQWITLAKGMGIWVESDSYTPKPGDFILYDWQDSGSGDNTGTPDHIGIVEKVASGKITVIEGNYNDMVKRRELAVNGKNIRGFVTPKYSD